MKSCPHRTVVPCPDGYLCLSCKQVWTQLSLIETKLPPMSTQTPSPTLHNSASTHPPVASGKTHQLPLKLSPVSASLDWDSASGKYHHCVRVYSSKGKLYYRYTANVGHDVIFDIHIPGGNVRNPIAKRRAETVRSWIREGFTPEEISVSILQWRERSR
jgi:hypothetical protein